MYAGFYGFRDLPFRVTPDPRLLYRNPCYDEVAAALRYGIEHRKGFVSLVGEVGTGKTTVLRHVIERLPALTRTVLVLHPTVSFEEMLEYILQDLGIPTAGAGKLGRLQRLHEFLIEHTRTGGNVALMVDEAQDLDGQVLEELRLLSNLETASEKILQIVLAGQPELERRLAQPELRQLRQRIALHLRLRPLNSREVTAYVQVRLDAVGGDRRLFTTDALARLAEVSGGIPRIINVLCDACLVTGVATGTRRIGADIVDEVWSEYAQLHSPGGPVHGTTDATLSPPESGLLTTAAAASLPSPDSPTSSGDAAANRPPKASTPYRMRTGLALATVATLSGALALIVRHGPSWLPASWPGGQALSALWARSVASPPTASGHPTAEGALAPPLGSEVPTAEEARALVDAYRAAYEKRDADALLRLFTEDAIDNDRRGLERIGVAYREAFGSIEDVRYALDDISVTPMNARMLVRASFRISYAYVGRGGTRAEMRGLVAWEIVTRQGQSRIAALRWEVLPQG